MTESPIAVTFARFSARYPSAGGVSFLVRQAFGWRHVPGTPGATGPRP